jgi:hypothetical protein
MQQPTIIESPKGSIEFLIEEYQKDCISLDVDPYTDERISYKSEKYQDVLNAIINLDCPLATPTLHHAYALRPVCATLAAHFHSWMNIRTASPEYLNQYVQNTVKIFEKAMWNALEEVGFSPEWRSWFDEEEDDER